MTGRRITVDSRRRRGGRNPGGREEGFLLVLLLQSAICVAMLVFAFSAGQYWGMTEVKSCFASMLSSETEAAEVFASVQGARESAPLARLRDWVTGRIDAALGLGSPGDAGGQLETDGVTTPSGVSPAWPVLSAAMRSPVAGTITSGFGARTHPITGKSDFHTGLDLAAPRGTPIGAAYPGRVVEVGDSDIYGNYITLFHGGFATRYCHCDSISAREGMNLRQGETVARVGSTGMSTGPHLHFEIIIEGKNADPLCAAQGEGWAQLL